MKQSASSNPVFAELARKYTAFQDWEYLHDIRAYDGNNFHVVHRKVEDSAGEKTEQRFVLELKGLKGNVFDYFLGLTHRSVLKTHLIFDNKNIFDIQRTYTHKLKMLQDMFPAIPVHKLMIEQEFHEGQFIFLDSFHNDFVGEVNLRMKEERPFTEVQIWNFLKDMLSLLRFFVIFGQEQPIFSPNSVVFTEDARALFMTFNHVFSNPLSDT